jgi:glycosyltransferase involved in cell wall biosynthesis
VRFDDQLFFIQSRGGASRYFAELVSAFADPRFGVVASSPFRWTHNEHLPEIMPGRFAVPPRAVRRARVMRAANRLAPHPEPDIWHHTWYHPPVPDLAVPRVVTVLDMIPELHPEMFPTLNPHAAKLDYVRAADLVLCISETTKRDLLRVAGPLDQPVVVTPLAVSRWWGDPSPRPATRPRRFLLYVGGRRVYKNFPVVLEALATVAQNDQPLDLVATGGGNFTDAEHESISNLGLSDYVHQVDATDLELRALFQHAHAFVFPSTYEGFGLPLLEAFEAGCPVLAADTACFREVAGDGAAFFDPHDAGELARLIAACGDDDVRAALRDAGREQVSQYSWQRTARITADAYRLIAG